MAGIFLQRSRHGTTYFFRRRVPDDIQHILKLQQLYRALATADRREAIIRARALAARTDQLFEQIRDMAKKKDDTLKAGLIVKWDADELGLPRFSMQTEAHDTPEDKQQAFAVAQRFAETRQAGAVPNGRVTDLKPGKSLRDAVDEFLKSIKNAKTFRAYRTALEHHAVPFFKPETLISSIDQEIFYEYVTHIFADETRAHSTKDGYINAFTSLFSWLRARYPKSTNMLSTRKLIPKKEEADAEQRDAFTLAHLKVLFVNAKSYRRDEPHKFWVTVATAFMGCRIEELAQVQLETDFRQDTNSGVWYLDLNDRADPDKVKRKSLKVTTSKRVVPIHSALVRHGFLGYLQAQLRAGATRPFEQGWQPWKEPAKGGVHWAHYIIRWGGRELEKLNTAAELNRDGLKLGYFHSMRHTFANILAERDVSEERRAALQGQAAPGAGENAKRYVKMRHDPRVLSQIVEAHLEDYSVMLDEVIAST